MKVHELIEVLEKAPQDADVLVCDPFYDCPSPDVHVNLHEGAVMIHRSTITGDWT